MMKIKIHKSSYPLGEDDDVREVAKVIITSPDGEVLLVKRADHMRWEPGKWDLPGGHRKQDEDILDAAVREVKEELGIDVGDLEKVTEINDITFFKTEKEKQDQYELDDENQEAKWVNISEIESLDLVPSVKGVLKKV